MYIHSFISLLRRPTTPSMHYFFFLFSNGFSQYHDAFVGPLETIEKFVEPVRRNEASAAEIWTRGCPP